MYVSLLYLFENHPDRFHSLSSSDLFSGTIPGTIAGETLSWDGVGAEDPTCFYCQKAAGVDAKDELLHCAEFDCNRSVHMKCCTPPLSKVG